MREVGGGVARLVLPAVAGVTQHTTAVQQLIDPARCALLLFQATAAERQRLEKQGRGLFHASGAHYLSHHTSQLSLLPDTRFLGGN